MKKMKEASIYIGVLCSFLLLNCQLIISQSDDIKRNLNFNNNWQFINDNIDNAEKVEFDDTNWRTLHLPHDISVEGLA